MKCDKLKAFNMPRYAGEFTMYKVYTKDEVDAAIDELKMEHHRERDEYIDWVNKLQRENSELKAMVTTDNSAVIARLEDNLRKTQRAMWMARAKRATEKADSFIDIKVTYCGVCNINNSVYPEKNARRMLTCDEWLDVWTNVWKKCLKKAKEYL